MKIRILVTGGHGQVGSAIAELGESRQLNLITLGRNDLDITDASQINMAFVEYQPDLLINTAAYTAVDKAESEPQLAYSINKTAIDLLANACALAKIPLLHISTDYVFDGTFEGPYTEEDPVNPLSVYGKSKEAGEEELRKILDRHVILRTSWVFGVAGNNFVKSILHLAMRRNRIHVVSDQVGGPTGAAFIAEGLLAIAAQYEASLSFPWGTYNYCQKPFVSRYQFALAIIQRATDLGFLENPPEVIPTSSSEFRTPVNRPLNSRLSTAKFESLSGASIPSWEKELDRVIQEFFSSDQI